VSRVCGPEIAEKCHPLWGLDEEGELQGAWKELGVKNGLRGLWYMMGNLALCRFHSTHLTLREYCCCLLNCELTCGLEIKAIEEGVMGSRYED